MKPIFLFMMLLAGAETASAQFVLRSFETAPGIGMLSGGGFTATVTLGGPLAGTSSNDDFTAAFGAGPTDAATPTGVEVSPTDAEVPDAFHLDQNYPNPFNPETTIAFGLPRAEAVMLAVYNALGQRVAVLADETRAAGRYEATWNAAGMPSGLYFYQIRAGDFQAVRKMVLLK